MKRRDWILRTGGAIAGLAVAPAYAAQRAFEQKLPAEDPVRLHSNENPLGPSAAARRAMTEAFDLGCRYPSEHYGELVDRIAKAERVSPDAVILGAGSHEILRLVATDASRDGGSSVVPNPTFESVAAYAEAAGGSAVRVPLTDTFDADLSRMLDAVGPGTRMFFVCNPNNPTGRTTPIADVRAVREALPDPVTLFVDEAYHEYVASPGYGSAVDLVREGANVVVSRTFSKVHGLAGMRVGYGIADPDRARALRGLRGRHPLSVVSVAAASASIADAGFIDRSRQANLAGRAVIYRSLERFNRRYLASDANFVFAHVGVPVRDFAGRMLEQGVRVGRPFPPYLHWCRISIGSADDMRRFETAFERVAPDLPKS